MEFTFGPRHRVVTRTRRLSFARAILTVLLSAALGVWLLLASMGVAHAGQPQELRAAAERLNSECRDNPRAVGACAARDGVLAQLRASGTCWNAKAATPAALWVPCARPLTTSTDLCDRSAEIAFTLALYRDAGLVPQVAYGRAVQLAKDNGLSPAPLQAMTWSVYAERGYLTPAAIRHASRYECRRAGGVL